MMRRLGRQRFDILLLVAILALVGIGTVMIYSSSSIIAQERYQDGYYFIRRHLVMVLIGLMVMTAAAKIPVTFWRAMAYPGVIGTFILLSLLFVPGIGMKVGGALRWMKVGGFSFHVSEVAKGALILFFAHYLAKKRAHAKEITRFMLVPLCVTGITVTLIALQPDFGTAVIIVAVVLAMFFLAGSRLINIAGVMAAAIPIGVLMVIRESYRLKRWLAFCNPWEDPLNSGFQIIQSFIAFGSGGAFGTGLGKGMQKLFYLPEPHTDFILPVIAEEGGFVCVAIVISLYVLVVIRGFVIALRSDDFFGGLLVTGLTTLIAIEAVINMAGVMGLMPTKGLVLPFVSYGGTSLVVSMGAVGVMLNISAANEKEPVINGNVVEA